MRSSESVVEIAVVELAAGCKLTAIWLLLYARWRIIIQHHKIVGLTPVHATSGKPHSPTLMDPDI